MTTVSVGDKVQGWAASLDAELLERQAPTRLALIALLSRHHLLLLGEPGTAKTLLAQRVASMLGSVPFMTLLTKFSTPEDVFGPLSLSGLEQGRYERLTEGYLPTAQVAFVDEIFKANASILNAMLSILNERRFFNGAAAQDVPLASMVAASNELPDDDEGLDALDDRLMLRVCVSPLREAANVAQLFKRSVRAATTPIAFTPADLRDTQGAASRVQLSDELVKVMLTLRDDCRAAELKVSDRRWRQAVDVMATCAAIDGDKQIQAAHLGVLRFVLWRRPSDQAKVIELLGNAIAKVQLTEVATSANEVIQLLGERRTELTKLVQEIQSTSSYSYTPSSERLAAIRPRALEATTKTREVLDAARKFQQEVLRVLAGRLQLWRPFWDEIVGRLPIAQAITALEHHEFLTDAVQKKLEPPP